MTEPPTSYVAAAFCRHQEESVRLFAKPARTYNLTVDVDHTFCVFAGPVSLLVHNCGELWTPDPQWSPEAIDKRLEEWAQQATLTKKHDLLARTVAADPSYPQRVTSDGADFWRNSGSARGWGDWEDAPIFDMEPPGKYGGQTRIMVHSGTGEIAWFPLKDGVHDYNNPVIYKYAKR